MAICVGCGLDVDINGRLHAQLRPGGGLSCQDTGAADDGLYVTPGVFMPATGGSGTIPPGSTSINSATGEVRKSPDACNGLDLRGNGVWAPRMCTLANTALRGYQGAIFPVGLSVGGTYAVESDGGAVSVTNNTDCTLMGKWDVQASGGRVLANPGFDASMYLGVNIDNTGWGPAIPITRIRMDNRTNNGASPNGGVVEYNAANFHEENWSPLVPGQTITFMANVNLVVTAGIAGLDNAGTWHDTPDFPRFEFHWHWTPEGNC